MLKEKHILLSVTVEEYEKIKAIALKEDRKIANVAYQIIRKYLEEKR